MEDVEKSRTPAMRWNILYNPGVMAIVKLASRYAAMNISDVSTQL